MNYNFESNKERNQEKIVLGEGCVLTQADIEEMPNNNQAVVGPTGGGKTLSTMMPSMLTMDTSSTIAVFAKGGVAHQLAAYMKAKGYQVDILDLAQPRRSTASFDPLAHVRDQSDIEYMARTVVEFDPDHSAFKDRYWIDAAAHLLNALINLALSNRGNLAPGSDSCGMADVLDLFDRLIIKENSSGKGIVTGLDRSFEKLEMKDPKNPGLSLFRNFHSLPYNTAGCVRDTLAASLRTMYPDSIRAVMRTRSQIDFLRIAREKRAVFIITSPVNPTLDAFANQAAGMAIKELLEFSQNCRDGRLPRPVRLLFDDFACSAPIHNFAHYISIFRAAGISTMLLLQSESQLSRMYGESDATTILNNCSVYSYFPGGMDLDTCRSVSQRLDIPLTDVLYMKPGKVVVMRSGHQPEIVPRYKTLDSPEYREFLQYADSALKSVPRENPVAGNAENRNSGTPGTSSEAAHPRTGRS